MQSAGCSSGWLPLALWHHRLPFLILVALTAVLAALPCLGADVGAGERVLEIPRVETPPKLEDFLEMKPSPAWEGRLAKADEFIQRLPSDGQPSSQRTDVYFAYDDKNFYCIYVAFDSEPKKVRAHMVPRDNLYGDERVDLFLDTFHDHRRAFVFTTNPFGIQMDGLWNEAEAQRRA